MPARVFVFGGKKRTIAELAKLFGKKPDLIRRDLRKGLTLTESLNRTLGRPRKYVVAGRAMNQTEAAKAIGVARASLYIRQKSGWKSDEIVSVSTHKRLITALGKTQTLAEWSREKGISPSALHKRLRKLPPEAALTAPVEKRVSRKKEAA